MVCDIEENMPPDELTYWVAYFEIKEARGKKKAKEEELKNKQGSAVKSKRFG